MKAEVETVLAYLRQLQLRLPAKIKKKHVLDRVNRAIGLTRDAIITDVLIESKPKGGEKER